LIQLTLKLEYLFFLLGPLRIHCAREIQLSIADSVERLLDGRIEALGSRYSTWHRSSWI